MTLLASIDPGVRYCGLALWQGEELQWAGLIRGLSPKQEPDDGAALLSLSRALREVVPSWIDEIAIELPQVYSLRAKQTGDQNDLIRLAASAGMCIGTLNALATWYWPHDWKGSVPKDIMVQRIIAETTPAETAKIKTTGARSDHNIWDAIGIGRHHLKRRKASELRLQQTQKGKKEPRQPRVKLHEGFESEGGDDEGAGGFEE